MPSPILFEKGLLLNPGILIAPSVFSVNHLLFLGIILFSIGLSGIAFNRSNALVLLMSIEVMFLGVSLTLISFGVFCLMPQGFVYALLVLALAAAESAIGLSLLIVYYRLNKSISLGGANVLKG